MRKVLFTGILCMALCSCSDAVMTERLGQMPTASGQSFSFDSITSPANWIQYQSLEEMLDACQIPEDVLKTMPTDELVATCVSHPLHSIYFAYNNELDGANVVFNNFNGFQELKNRADAPEKLLNLYRDVNFAPQAMPARYRRLSDFTNLGFVELYLASKQLPALYVGDNLAKLEKISNSVLEKKLKDPNCSIYNVQHSLLINAQIKLAEGNVSVEDERVLSDFLKFAGNVQDADMYTKVSQIVSR